LVHQLRSSAHVVIPDIMLADRRPSKQETETLEGCGKQGRGALEISQPGLRLIVRITNIKIPSSTTKR
jgi:hypothetical protein